MSQLRMSKNRDRAGAWERLWENFAGSQPRLPRSRKPRRLMIDQLEERALLSVSPAGIDDTLINSAIGVGYTIAPSPTQSMLSAKSVAMDNNGDFVVTWERNDVGRDATGQPLVDPATGGEMTDYNIYARYFTHAIQRITLPASLSNGGSFALQYNGNEVQKLTISAGTTPFFSAGDSSNTIIATFNLTFTDSNGGTHTATGVSYDETLTLSENAEAIQTALQGLVGGGAAALDGVTVQAIDAHNFQISFGNASQGKPQPLLTVANLVATAAPEADFPSFLPAINVTMVREPGMTVNIPISHSASLTAAQNMAVTAQNIEYAFQLPSASALPIPGYPTGATNFDIAPIVFPILTPPGPYSGYNSMRTALPAVTVTARSATEFDITFTGDLGYQQQPLLVVLDPASTPSNLVPLAGATAAILKQSGSEFRVNAPEYQLDPTQIIRPDVYDQMNPQVAMDADGDFVITWQGEVPNSQTPLGPNAVFDTDIFARRFSPAGWVAPAQVSFVADMKDVLGQPGANGVSDTPIQGIRPLGSEFRVNTATTNRQSLPSVGMDGSGNFTIAWQSEGQTISFFNYIDAQRFDRDGNRLGNEFLVDVFQVNTVDDPTAHYDPYVAVSRDGIIAIAWGWLSTIQAKVYDAQGAVLVNEFNVTGTTSWSPAITFNAVDDFVVTWGAYDSATDLLGTPSTGVYATEYQLYDYATHDFNFQRIRDPFLVNGSSATTPWPNLQDAAQPAMDADGDLTISYSGFAPDVVEGDVDWRVEQQLITAKLGGATDNQLAQLRLNLETAYYYNRVPGRPPTRGQDLGLTRGEANGAMYAQYDADPRIVTGLLQSDSVANNHRDGQNTRWLLDIDSQASSGGFTLRLTNPRGVRDTTDIAIPVFFNNGGVNPAATLDAIHDALSALSNVGVNWEQDPYEGPISVRLVAVPVPDLMDPTLIHPGQEILDRMGTPWDPTVLGITDINIVYEITFIGELHDQFVGLEVRNNTLTKKIMVVDEDGVETEVEVDVADPFALCETYGWGGTDQYDASIGMTASGNYVMAWNEDALRNDGSVSNTNFYFRSFQESTDTAGPSATDFLLPNTGNKQLNNGDTRLNDGATVTDPLRYIVVTFDEDMLNTGATGVNSVTNPNNWALMRDGTLLVGGITKVYYGMNEATANPLFASLNMPASNKWEAVLELSGNGNSQTTSPYLPDGHYQIVATTALRDKAGNALGRTGFQLNGATFSRSFDVVLPTGTETRVNASATGDQYTSPANEIQQITFVPTAAPPPAVLTGKFGLSIGSYYSGDDAVDFDSGNLTAVAAAVQTQLRLAGYNGAVVTVVASSASSYVLSVRFGGVDAGMDEPPISISPTGLAANATVEEIQKGDAAPPPQATASDANGDYVTVWTSDTLGASGVYAKLYNATWNTTVPRTSNVTVGTEILVTPAFGTRNIGGALVGFTNAGAASVAMDAGGDFVVTWSEKDAADWNVWYRRYSAAGVPLDFAQRANTTTEDVQRHSAVGVDADGDFVVTWQSLNQDGDGYGVYAQRYDAAGNPLGGQSSAQTLSFVGRPTGTFALRTSGGDTAAISYQGNAAATARLVEAELQKRGQSVRATAVSTAKILIEYVGAQANQLRPQLSVINDQFSGDPGATATVQAAVQGSVGEFRVNDTTINNQMFPSIAMDASGAFVITWTGYGQDGDAAYQANVYAKQFVSSDSLISSSSTSAVRMQNVVAPAPVGAVYKPLVVTTDDPANHIVAPGSGMDGVVQLIVYRSDLPQGFVALGSGTLLLDGRHVLTAAHLVDDDFGNMVATSVDVVFALTSGYVTITVPASGVFDHPQYTGLPWVSGGDLAVLALPQLAPAGVDRHDINRQPGALGQTFTMVGYGNSGTGQTGDTIATAPNAPKRRGQNKWEGYASLAGAYPDALIYDFDSGQAQNDAFGSLYNIHNLGVGTNEASTAPGDSGGPNFLPNGLIGGVTSYGWSQPGAWDAVPGTNSSFGDMGADVDVSLYASWIDTAAQGTPEFRVNTTGAADQKWSSVALDADGDFVITWTSYGQDGGGNGPGAGAGGLNGVYAQRYDSDGATVGGEFRATTFTANDQQSSKVAISAAGDFTIVWESYQDRTAFNGAGVNPTDVADSFGIYGQRYVRNSLIGQPIFTGGPVITGPNGEYLTEFQVNTTHDGDQRYPSISMDDNGDFLVVWSGIGTQPGQSDTQGVFLQRFDLPSDTAGPRAIATFNWKPGTTTLQPVRDGQELVTVADPVTKVVDATTQVRQFVVTFDEAMMTTGGATGANSVLNPANWSLSRNGTVTPGRIASVAAYAGVANTYVVTFDGDLITPDAQALGSGSYVLTATDNIQDQFGNALDGNVDGLPGGSFSRSFTVNAAGGGGGGGTTPAPGPGTPPAGTGDTPVNATQAGSQYSPVVAADENGNYVIVWADSGQIMAQRYDNTGKTLGTAITVNAQTFAIDFSNTAAYLTPPRLCDVAMDPSGNFVVVWSGFGSSDQQGVYARVYDAGGAARGAEFLVNQHLPGLQYQPSVAMDADGDFAVTWTSYGQDGEREGIIGRRFNLQGQALSGEFQVNAAGADKQVKSDVAMDLNGDFAVVWESYGQDGNMWGVYGQRFNAAGAKAGGEFRVNQQTVDKQMDPQVAMDTDGDFVVAWTSFGQDSLGYGVYARRYNAAGAAVGGEFRVSSVTPDWRGQITPDVGMDRNGNFVVTWSSYGQEQLGSGDLFPVSDYGIYARMFNAGGTDYADPTTGQVLGEFRVNASTSGDQINPAIGVSQNGEAAIAWVGPYSFGTAIYSRLIGWGSSILGTTTQSAVAGLSTVGLYNPAASVFYLRDANSSGVANATFGYGPASSGWITLTGDWDGNGTETIGLYDPAASRFYLRNSNNVGMADVTFAYGPAGGGWKPIVGDWNGDGRDTVGLYDPNLSRFYLRNTNTTGYADVTFSYGPAQGGWTPLVGDWNGDGKETIGLHDPGLSRFYLRDSNSSGYANVTFAFGPAGAGWQPLTGDWNQDGKDTVGLYNAATAVFYQRNTNTSGIADATFSYGPANIGWLPLAGNWTGTHALVAAGGPAASQTAATLTQADLQPIIHEAIARWTDAGLSAAAVARLSQVQFVVADLSGSLLGEAAGNRVYLDANAAGYGWFVDATAAADEEFAPAASNGRLRAVDPRAVDRIDLLTVVEHELGHIIGLDDLDALTDNLMSGVLGVGARRSASHHDAVDAILAN